MFLKPTYLIAGDITDVSIEQLSQDGIKGLILDLDSTLMAPKSAYISPEAKAWLEKALTVFQVAIASNNHNEEYLDKVRLILNIVVIGNAAKPSRKAFRKLLADFALKPEQVAVIGDRPLTDIWGGHRAGMKTVLVRTLKTMQEPEWKQSVRNLERIFIQPN